VRKKGRRSGGGGGLGKAAHKKGVGRGSKAINWQQQQMCGGGSSWFGATTDRQERTRDAENIVNGMLGQTGVSPNQKRQKACQGPKRGSGGKLSKQRGRKIGKRPRPLKASNQGPVRTNLQRKLRLTLCKRAAQEAGHVGGVRGAMGGGGVSVRGGAAGGKKRKNDAGRKT